MPELLEPKHANAVNARLCEQLNSLAAHIREPVNNAGPTAIEDRRLHIYRELFFNNIEGFLASGFPVFKSLFDELAWQAIVRDFMANFRCETPYFLEISEEFLRYLENPQLALHQAYPFALQLCHYEWVELALEVKQLSELEEQLLQAPQDKPLNLATSLQLSPLAMLLNYDWPVHHIGPETNLNTLEQALSCFVVYRDAADKVKFIEANPATLSLLLFIEQQPGLCIDEYLALLAEQMQLASVSQIEHFALDILNNMHAMGVVLAP